MSISSETIRRARDCPIERVIDGRGIKLRGRIERVGACPICGGTDRFAVNTRKGVFNCRGCGIGGDVIALTRFLDGSDFPTACALLAGERPARSAPSVIKSSQTTIGVLPSIDPSADDYERQQRAKAQHLYGASKVAAGTLVDGYLRTRGITAPLPATVRFLPPLKPGHHPAMLVPFGLASEPEPGVLYITQSEINAIQLTLLRQDGTGKADTKPNKLTIGSPAGMPMVLAPMGDLLGLGICEGVEDALSVHCATGLGAWASGGAGFMPKLIAAIEILAAREYDASPDCVTIFAHADPAGQRSARELAEALVARKAEVFLEGIDP